MTSRHKQDTLSTEGVHSTSKNMILNSRVTISLYPLITLLLTSIEFALAVTYSVKFWETTLKSKVTDHSVSLISVALLFWLL